LLGIHIGNHEYRIPKEVGLSPAEILATELGVPYLGFQGYHVLKVNSLQTNQTQVYNMMSYHGTGAGSTIGSLVNAAERGDKVCTNCDLYISGHTHAKNFHVKTVFNLDQATASLVPFNRYYVICGSFLEYWGSYAEMKLLPPQETGAVMITLNSSKKEIKISY
jgi:hypothetical protein